MNELSQAQLHSTRSIEPDPTRAAIGNDIPISTIEEIVEGGEAVDRHQRLEVGFVFERIDQRNAQPSPGLDVRWQLDFFATR